MESQQSNRGIILCIVTLLFAMGCSNEEEPATDTAEPTTRTSVEAPPSASEETTAPSDPVVAKVGPLEFHLNDLLKLTQENETSKLLKESDEEAIERLRSIRKETLTRMIDRRLLILGAAQYPEWVSDASWEEEVQVLYSTLGTEEIERRRTASGATKEEFDEQFGKFVREEMMIRELVAREVNSVTPATEEELQKKYEEERDTHFTRPDSWAVYHIDRYIPREESEQLPTLLEELEGIRSKVHEAIRDATSIKDKAVLMEPHVKEHSQAEDAQTGYAYIYDNPEVSFDSEFLNRVRTATLGELSPVFELTGNEERVGGCFFLVFQHRPGETVSFENAQRILEKKMMEEATKDNRDELFDRLEKQFPVQVFEDFLYQGMDP